MKVKVFDENHEHDLEMRVNEFLETLQTNIVIDIKYQLATLYDGRAQIYCFSCMIIYEDNF